MIRINLLPIREIKKKQGVRQLIFVGVLSLVLVFLSLGVFHFSVVKRIGTLQSEIETTKQEISRLNKIVGDVKKYEKEKKELEKKIEIIDVLNQKRAGPVYMLDELSKNIPTGAWITSLSENNLKLTLHGVALDNETIAGFMSRLENSTYFSNVELIQSGHYRSENLNLKKFNITLQVVLSEKK
jgi:type IV pilus assembly protein PilN